MDDVNHLQFVAITFDDGSLGVMAFNLTPRFDHSTTDLPGYDKKTGFREASDEAIQHEIDKSVYDHAVTGWRRISFEDIPQDRTYRNAQMDTGTKIDHDMVKAREIQRNKLRIERAPLLAQLDADYLNADETGDEALKASIAQQKQLLRDATADPAIDAAQSIDDLKAVVLPSISLLAEPPAAPPGTP